MNGTATTFEVVKAKGAGPFGDRAFKWLTLFMALVIFALIIHGCELAGNSGLTLRRFGWHFLFTSTWDPVNEQFRQIELGELIV